MKACAGGLYVGQWVMISWEQVCFQGASLCTGPESCCRIMIIHLPSGMTDTLLSLSLIGLGL